jgi:hypothetical protein
MCPTPTRNVIAAKVFLDAGFALRAFLNAHFVHLFVGEALPVLFHLFAGVWAVVVLFA